MAGADQLWPGGLKNLCTAAVHVQLEAVPQHGCLGGPFATVRLVKKDIVTGEGDARAVDGSGNDGVKLRLSGGMPYPEIEATPVKRLAIA